MRRKEYTVAASAGGNSVSPIFVPDVNLNPFNIGFGAVVNSSCAYTISHTFDNVLVSGATNWFPHEFVVATAGNADGNYAFPCAGVQVQVSANSTGSVTVVFIQAG